MTTNLTNLAIQMKLTPAEAVYLPAAVQSIAKIGGLFEFQAAARIASNAALCDYVVATIRKLAATEDN